VFANDFIGAVEAHDPDAGGIDFKDLFLVVQDNALAGAFEQGAEFFLGHTQPVFGFGAPGFLDGKRDGGGKPGNEIDFLGGPLPGRAGMLVTEHADNVAAHPDRGVEHGRDAVGLEIGGQLLCRGVVEGVVGDDWPFLGERGEVVGTFLRAQAGALELGVGGLAIAQVEPFAADRGVVHERPIADAGDVERRRRVRADHLERFPEVGLGYLGQLEHYVAMPLHLVRAAALNAFLAFALGDLFLQLIVCADEFGGAGGDALFQRGVEAQDLLFGLLLR